MGWFFEKVKMINFLLLVLSLLVLRAALSKNKPNPNKFLGWILLVVGGTLIYVTYGALSKSYTGELTYKLVSGMAAMAAFSIASFISGIRRLG